MQIFRKGLVVVAFVAVAIWMGGMLALGAIAAPIVFRVVPAPANADAMTAVFRRFDMVAMVCAAVVVLVEAILAATRRPITPRDMARGAVAVVAGGLAVWQGAFLSPKIEALHRAGAIRGQGALGLDLDATHHLAELNGKALALLLVILVALHVFSIAAPDARGAPAG